MTTPVFDRPLFSPNVSNLSEIWIQVDRPFWIYASVNSKHEHSPRATPGVLHSTAAPGPGFIVDDLPRGPGFCISIKLRLVQ